MTRVLEGGIQCKSSNLAYLSRRLYVATYLLFPNAVTSYPHSSTPPSSHPSEKPMNVFARYLKDEPSSLDSQS